MPDFTQKAKHRNGEKKFITEKALDTGKQKKRPPFGPGRPRLIPVNEAGDIDLEISKLLAVARCAVRRHGATTSWCGSEFEAA